MSDAAPSTVAQAAATRSAAAGGAGPGHPATVLPAKARDPEPEAPLAPQPAEPIGGKAAPAPGPATAAPVGASRKGRRALLFALVPVALIAGGYAYVTGGQVMSTDNAYVQSAMLAVSTDVSGIVRGIAVHENQTVAAGDELFRLDDQPFRLALAGAEAQIGIVRNDLTALKASYHDMQEQIRQAEVDIAFYQREYQRQQTLASSNFASQAALDASRHNLDLARQKKASLTQQLAGIVANLNGDPDAPIENHPRYKAAVATRDEAARQLSHTIVKASFAGIVTNVPSLQVGQYLPASTPAFSLVASDHVWVQASPKETELTYVRPGQPVSVSVDTYPGVVWRGTVESISPASAASFSLLPAQNTSGNWVKVVQRIPMRVRLDTPAGKPPLRVGMSVVADVDTGRARGLPEPVARLFGLEPPRHE